MLISSRTPLRVSFFGGGTDYPEYFERKPGAVVGMAIDKYIYTSVLKLGAFLEYKYRVSYSRLERVDAIAEIRHPVVRSVLDLHRIEDALDIGIMSDLPASTGLGSSSAFTVGFLNLVSALKGERLTKMDLAHKAIHIERNVLQERVGVQDQLHTSFGGINRFDFANGDFSMTPIQMTADCQSALMDSLFLVYTEVARHASETLEEQITATKESRVDNELAHLYSLTTQAVSTLKTKDPDALLGDFGRLMHEGWMTKRKLSRRISTPLIDGLYDTAREAGALGGKLCGAGAGGFLLMVVPPVARSRFLERIKPAAVVPIGLDTQGSVILHG